RKQDRLALLRLQLAQAARKGGAVSRALERGEWARAVARDALDDLALDVDHLGVYAANPVEGTVAHDARHPGHWRGEAFAVIGRAVPDPDVAILQHLFSQALLPDYTQRDAEQFRRVL